MSTRSSGTRHCPVCNSQSLTRMGESSMLPQRAVIRNGELSTQPGHGPVETLVCNDCFFVLTYAIPRLAESGRAGGRPRPGPKRSKSPRSEYYAPILRVLAKHGGSARVGQLITEFGVEMKSRFTEVDLEELSSGGPRRKKDVNFAGMELKHRGQILKERGTWSLTEAGLLAASSPS